MSDSLIQFPAIARGASFAGTCLTHTMIFTRCFLLLKLNPVCGTYGRGCYLPDHRLKISAALVPPKPNEFESAYSTDALRARFGTKPRSHAESGVSRLMVRARIWPRNANPLMPASS